MANKHEEDLRVLHQKLNLHTDNSLNKFKQTALVSNVYLWNYLRCSQIFKIVARKNSFAVKSK